MWYCGVGWSKMDDELFEEGCSALSQGAENGLSKVSTEVGCE